MRCPLRPDAVSWHYALFGVQGALRVLVCVSALDARCGCDAARPKTPIACCLLGCGWTVNGVRIIRLIAHVFRLAGTGCRAGSIHSPGVSESTDVLHVPSDAVAAGTTVAAHSSPARLPCLHMRYYSIPMVAIPDTSQSGTRLRCAISLAIGCGLCHCLQSTDTTVLHLGAVNFVCCAVVLGAACRFVRKS